MADDSLTERYLAGLRARLSHRSDRDGLLDEIADHLHTAAERFEASGASSAAAEYRAVVALGDEAIVAELLSTVPLTTDRVAVAAGRALPILAGIAALAWCALAGVFAFGADRFDGFSFWPDSYYALTAATVAAAILVSACALFALNVQATGVADDAALGIGVIGTVGAALSFILWFPLWIVILAVTVMWTVARTWRARMISRTGGVLMAATPAVTAIMAVSSVWTDVGGRVDVVVGILAFGMCAALAAGFVDVVVRSALRASRARAVVV